MNRASLVEQHKENEMRKEIILLALSLIQGVSLSSAVWGIPGFDSEDADVVRSSQRLVSTPEISDNQNSHSNCISIFSSNAQALTRGTFNAGSTIAIHANDVSFDLSSIKGWKGINIKADNNLAITDSTISSRKGSVKFSSKNTSFADTSVTAKENIQSSATNTHAMVRSTFEADGFTSVYGKPIFLDPSSSIEGREGVILEEINN